MLQAPGSHNKSEMPVQCILSICRGHAWKAVRCSHSVFLS